MTERIVKCKYGFFKFILVDYPGPSPLTDIWFNNEHVGYWGYMNLDTASDLELLSAAAAFDSNE